MTANEQSFVGRPAVASAGLGVALAVVAVALVAGTAAQRQVLAVGVAGAVAFAVGVDGWRSTPSVAADVVAAVGAVLVLAAVVLALVRPMFAIHRFELVPGLLGIWVLAAGVGPVRRGWERRLVSVGTGLVFLAVVVSGVVQTTDLWPLLVATAATIVSWDVSENAVSLGAQVGEDARTLRAEVAHVLGSLLVAGTAILTVYLVRGFGVTDLPLAALAALLVAGVALAVAHYR